MLGELGEHTRTSERSLNNPPAYIFQEGRRRAYPLPLYNLLLRHRQWSSFYAFGPEIVYPCRANCDRPFQ